MLQMQEKLTCSTVPQYPVFSLCLHQSCRVLLLLLSQLEIADTSLCGPLQADIGPTVEDTHSSISRDSQQNEAMAKLRSFSVEEVDSNSIRSDLKILKIKFP